MLAHGSKSDNFDKSMCTKAKNPFGVLPLVTQKLDCSPCIESRENFTEQKVSTIFPFEQVPLLKLFFCIEILTSRNVNVDRLTREYFDETDKNLTDFFLFQFSWSTLEYLSIKKSYTKKVDLIF